MARTKRFYQYDAQGNTRALSVSTGTVTDTFTYSAFGTEIARTGTTKTPFRWNGRVGYYWDADTQSYQVRRRPYRPTTGRWLTNEKRRTRNDEKRGLVHIGGQETRGGTVIDESLTCESLYGV